MEIIGGLAVVVLLFWLRGRFYRNRFRRALRAMNRGGVAERAKWAFWQVAAACVVVILIWAHIKDHAR